MASVDNYLIQAENAKKYFLRYDQEKIIQKLKLESDDSYLYATLFSLPYRINRTTGDVSRREGDSWTDANTHSEVMTLMDLICDSRENRYLACRWKSMAAFGLMFHKTITESSADPWALLFQENPEALRRACLALGGKPLPQGDVAYSIEVFDGLPIALQFWEGDEEFPPQVRYLWDENALMYIKYETMYFAVNLLLRRIREFMENI